MFLELIYPKVCGFCGKLNKNALCKKCEYKLKRIETLEIKKFENECFDEHIYFFRYEGEMRRIILNYKFNDKAYLYESFVKFMIKNEKFMEFLKSYDIIIPVPISRKRYRKRGYNQSLLIAKKIVEIYNKQEKQSQIKINTKCLYKTKDTIEQSKLNKKERIKNVQGVYEIKNEKLLEKKRILLIDDIYTTGNTIRQCSQMIKKAKPQAVGVITIAKDFVNKGKE